MHCTVALQGKCIVLSWKYTILSGNYNKESSLMSKGLLFMPYRYLTKSYCQILIHRVGKDHKLEFA
jgi:hypothetical protein